MRAILAGALTADPEQATSKAGKQYAKLRMKLDGQEAPTYALVMAFGSSVERALGLRKGDAVAASGTLKVSIYAPDGGEPKVNLSLLADEVISTRRTKKPTDDDDQSL